MRAVRDRATGGIDVRDAFRKFAHTTSEATGSPWAFILAVLVLVVWAVSGPLFHFSDSWQLYANTGTTIVTFLMVFLIQNTQNRDAQALHLKLDELLKGVEGARTGMVDLEEMTDEELQELQDEFKRLHERRKDEVQQVDEKVEARTGR
jgi:low affinity Fe/Cu permease